MKRKLETYENQCNVQMNRAYERVRKEEERKKKGFLQVKFYSEEVHARESLHKPYPLIPRRLKQFSQILPRDPSLFKVQAGKRRYCFDHQDDIVGHTTESFEWVLRYVPKKCSFLLPDLWNIVVSYLLTYLFNDFVPTGLKKMYFVRTTQRFARFLTTDHRYFCSMELPSGEMFYFTAREPPYPFYKEYLRYEKLTRDFKELE